MATLTAAEANDEIIRLRKANRRLSARRVIAANDLHDIWVKDPRVEKDNELLNGVNTNADSTSEFTAATGGGPSGGL